MTDKRRKPINRLVAPETVRLLKSLAESLHLSEGRVIDRAVAALAVAESFGGEHLKLSDPVVYGDGSGLTLRRSQIVNGDPNKSGRFTASLEAVRLRLADRLRERTSG